MNRYLKDLNNSEIKDELICLWSAIKADILNASMHGEEELIYNGSEHYEVEGKRFNFVKEMFNNREFIRLMCRMQAINVAARKNKNFNNNCVVFSWRI
jgi:hypothetical protein